VPAAKWAWLASVTVAAATYAATVWVPGWHRDEGIVFGTLVATLAIWGISQSINRNIEVLAVREENARLALDDERNRFARDLHDILGHSLTVITVKAELANRLIDVDADRARVELADLERLSRDALADVRRAVEGYRELTLPASSPARDWRCPRPRSPPTSRTDRRRADRPARAVRWAVREGITNVIRHSGAQRCTVVLGEHEVEVRDDGGARPPRRRTRAHRSARARGRPRGTVVTQSLNPASHSGSSSRDDPTPARRRPGPRPRCPLGAAEPRAGPRGRRRGRLGDAVVAAVLEHRPDVALLDVEMPGLDGISAAAEVRRVSPATRS
jgi:two-component system sensor histidine kinase DesK